MRILTVRHPWSHAIVWGGKDVENRTRNVAGAYRGPVAIHAAARVNPIAEWYDFARTHPRSAALLRDAPSGIETFGAIIGVVDLVDVHRNSDAQGCLPSGNHDGRLKPCSGWAEPGAHHLVLASPRPLTEPIPFKGALGLRRLDDDTTARILAQIGDPT
ncbi:hypothetical protein [Microbacterium sp. PM5]|uniref:hypothetical protein n=1 Tax=Microbacterium sp. PM5 TaxID=2014534 RepID=UPI000DD13DF7|nr:hypothetical protein [Microbacterium sp. PM5]AXA97603.1 hypothetical protein CEP17_14900 [Microbacterium sp. PM5]